MPVEDACELCARTMVLRRRGLSGGYVCEACHKKFVAKRFPCRTCGVLCVPALRLGEDEVLCTACYQVEVHRAACTTCERNATIAMRDEGGRPYCPPCARRLFSGREPCAICHHAKVVHARAADGTPTCHSCYNRDAGPRAKCVICEREKTLALRINETGGVCAGCHSKRRRKERCTRCSFDRPCRPTLDVATFVCHACTRGDTREPCVECHEARIVCTRIDGRPLCQLCHRRRLAAGIALRRTPPVAPAHVIAALDEKRADRARTREAIVDMHGPDTVRHGSGRPRPDRTRR